MTTKFLSAFTALLLLQFTCKCSAQQPQPRPPPPGDAQQYLQPHNQARSDVRVGPIRWSPVLAASASLTVRLQRDKHNCSFADLSNSRYGANQLLAGGSRLTPLDVVNTWVAEKAFYSYGNNSCAPSHQCGSYTQVVWKNSVAVGCAQATCAKERYSLTVCFYDPPGNVVGEKPY